MASGVHDGGISPGVESGSPFSDSGGELDAGALSPDGGSGSCVPGDVSNFTPTWKPPVGPYTGACSAQQLDQGIVDCFAAGTASQKACNGWFGDPSNAACGKCWAGPVTAMTWAPFVYALNPGESNYVNVSGCLALADPATVQCAEVVQADFTCTLAACLANCPLAATPSTADLAALEACQLAANAGGCKSFGDEVDRCAGGLVDGGATSFCFAANKDVTALGRFFALACGMPPVSDAGSGGG